MRSIPRGSGRRGMNTSLAWNRRSVKAGPDSNQARFDHSIPSAIQNQSPPMTLWNGSLWNPSPGIKRGPDSNMSRRTRPKGEKTQNHIERAWFQNNHHHGSKGISLTAAHHYLIQNRIAQSDQASDFTFDQSSVHNWIRAQCLEFGLHFWWKLTCFKIHVFLML